MKTEHPFRWRVTKTDAGIFPYSLFSILRGYSQASFNDESAAIEQRDRDNDIENWDTHYSPEQVAATIAVGHCYPKSVVDGMIFLGEEL